MKAPRLPRSETTGFDHLFVGKIRKIANVSRRFCVISGEKNCGLFPSSAQQPVRFGRV